MRLSKNTWSDDDIMKLNIYLQGFKGNNQDWTKKIYNTKKNCLAVPIPKLRQISKEILNGNYLQLLEVYFRNIEKSNNLINDLNIDLNLIIGSLICCIEDVNLINKYLLMYGKISDSWVETDIIKLKINNKNKGKCFEIAKKCLKSKHIFVRRLGIIIFFRYIQDADFINKIFFEIEKLIEEKEYYVNMAIAWLLCECFIKKRDETLNFLNHSNLNNFVMKKFIEKSRDSFRVSKEDKEILKSMKFLYKK